MKTQVIKQTCPCCGKEVEGEEVEVKFGRAALRYGIGALCGCAPSIFNHAKNDKKDEEDSCTFVNCAFHCNDCDYDWNEDVKILNY